MSEGIKLNYFEQAIENLKIVMSVTKTDIVRDSAIKRYEICYELAWKSIQELLKDEGLELCKSPKSCFKEAFQQEWIDDEKAFSEMVAKRNLTTHTYDEALAEIVYQEINSYLSLFEGLLKKMENQR